MASHARFYTRNMTSDGNQNISNFYDISTSISRPKMNFRISSDLASFLIYYYSISNNPNYDSIINTQEWRIDSVSSSALSPCNITQYINSASCTNGNCIGCLDNNNCYDVCYLNCRSCSNSSFNSCTACNSGFYLSNGVCLLDCPLLSSKSIDACAYQTNNQIAEWDFNVNRDILDANGLSFQSAYANSFQYRRGWYTNKINVNGKFFLSPTFSLAAWLKISGPMNFISKFDASYEKEIYIRFESSMTSVNLSTLNGQIYKTFEVNFRPNSWFNFKIGYKMNGNNLEIQAILSGAISSKSMDNGNAFKLSTTENTSIGDSSFFWIYKMKIRQSASISTQLDDYNFNENSLYSSWICEPTFYYDNGCKSCLPGCNNCKFGTNCTFCIDPLCSECDLYSGNQCSNCIPNAEKIDTICKCSSTFYDLAGQCINCNNRLCTECNKTTPKVCSKCKTNAYLNAASDCICNFNHYKLNDECVYCPDSSCQKCSGTCTECKIGYYLINGICNSCLSQCNTCVNQTISGCLTCKRLLNNICSNSCPNYYIVSSSNICSEGNAKGFNLLINKNSMNLAINDSTFTFTYSDYIPSSLPRIAVHRGLYMYSHSLLTSQSPFMVSNIYTFKFLIRPLKESTLDINGIFIFNIGSNNVTIFNAIIYLDYNLDLQSWILATIKYTDLNESAQVSVIFNQITLGTKIVPSFYDSSRIFTISANKGNLFEGWIYGISYSILLNDYTSYDDLMRKLVLWNCDYNQANISGECKTCSSTCATCRFIDTCTLCSSPYCAECDSFESTCKACIPGAISIEGNCSCPANYVREFSSCVKCHYTCTTCETHAHIDCKDCIKYVNGQCSTSCPTYTTDLSSNCSFLADAGFSFSFGDSSTVTSTFLSDRKDFQFTYKSSSDLTSQPIIGYNRGLYFENSLLENPSSMILSNQFSIEIWAFALSNGDLFNKNLLKLKLLQDQFRVFMNTAGNISYYNSINSEIIKKWQMYRIAVSIEDKKIKMIVSVNLNEQVFIIENTFLETTASIMSIGTSNFKGWVYSIKYSLNSFTSLLSPENSLRSLATSWVDLSIVLWPCEPRFYFENNICKACSTGCKTCRYNDTCSLCSNRMCTKCDSFESSECSQCSSDSINDGGSCICEQNKFIVGSKCNSCNQVCTTCSSANFNSCLQCKKHLNSYCIDICPLFYDDLDSTCQPQVKTSVQITFDRIDRIIQSDNAALTLKYSPSDFLPLFGYQRGAFMNKTWLQSSVPAKFSNIFSILFWVIQEL